MAVSTAEIPLLSYGHSITRVPKFKKALKILKKDTTPSDSKNLKQTENGEKQSTLQKIGAFGISVKKSQSATDYSKNQKVTSDQATSPIQEVAEEEEIENSDIKQLPTVEISIRKKIKRRIMLRHAGNADAMTSSDKQVIEDLRQNLRTRTKEHGGTKSILEAIGDPKLREARFYYEPLTKFLSGNDKQQRSMKGQRRTPFSKTANGYLLNHSGYTPDIGLLNIMGPPSHHHLNTPVDHRLGSTSHSLKQPRSGAKHYPIFPKMQNQHFPTPKPDPRTADRLPVKSSLHGVPEQINYSLSPSSVPKNENNDNGRKTEFSLPSISLHMQQDYLENPSAATKLPQKPSANMDQERNAKRKLFTQPVEHVTKRTRPRMGRPQPVTRATVGYSPGIKLTASGKSHLIGPMNKMDMIVEYSKLLQDKVINYEQYIKKLSKLSLHKIDLGNQGSRHYHIVSRDGTTGMKPRLARVDVYPSRKTHPDETRDDVEQNNRDSTKQINNFKWTGITRRETAKTTEGRINHQRSSIMGQSRNLVGSAIEIPSVTPHEGMSPHKNSHLRMSRVSIGQEIPESRFEHRNTGYEINNDEYLTYDDVIRMQGTDIDRYRHVHRPRNVEKHNYRWNHIPPSDLTYSSAAVNKPHGATRNIDPSGELYNGFSGRLLPNSREIKRRLNFSYPSYKVTLDGTNHVSKTDENTTTALLQGQENKNMEDSSHDPDYLAITLDQPAEKSEKNTSPDARVNTSSLSVHDVTIPTEIKVITGVIQQTNGNQKKKPDIDLKPNNAGPNSLKSSFEALNITPVAITSSSVVNANPPVNKAPYFVSQDDFVATGTNGVMQTHLSAIYRSINKAKSSKKDAADVQVTQPGKNSPPNVSITRMTNTSEITPEIEKTIAENAQLLQPNKRFPPPNTPPPKTTVKTKQPIQNMFLPQDLVIPAGNTMTTSQLPVSSSPTSSLPSVPKISLVGSPPPTAFLLQAREDEVTSVESDDDMNDHHDAIGVNDVIHVNDVICVNDVIDVNVTIIPVD